MKSRLPSLNALRAFEATVRLGTVAGAADALHVTPAAVSHQIKALEADLGVTLLRREGRHVVPTEAAGAGLSRLRDGFEALADGVARIRRTAAGPILTVSVVPTFAITWLVPRLERFRLRHPDIAVRIDADSRLADFAASDVDLAVRYAAAVDPDLTANLLFEDAVIPVCNPELVTGPTPLRTPADLVHHTLIHGEVRAFESPYYPDWAIWLKAAGVTGVRLDGGLRFFQESLAIQAALSGHGVALAGRWTVEQEIAAGRLVQPFGPDLLTGACYWIVAPPDRAGTVPVRAFCDWLLAEGVAAQAALGCG